ncbi:FadR family transcriptional regulator [Alicyclobacillus cycloheptanicus]|uniref:GntR family transcriptional repressor for pyruvate dehydrogenase complex n=1 Tax=Alicyclobacillus cycloheptanicus TaxID=1457 RepID=A0ABT9XKD8_9BACL|nr:GntR family transcriptional regulator [Alicyclobacillus cycloheptanicus]MDQ0190762.1 GntR family transcriptional repressor for pyruvate dehydrogenase complex [Alicyclobacillus cycloheptanicus]WDL99853.1 FadR family transcriptional regulator [Alicyclobacillus cycloheptanicus]
MAGHELSRSKLYVEIAQTIRTMIEEGRWQPGDKLPTLAELAAMFDCSRATVREALGALRGQGLVEFRHGDGTYVRTASVEMWMEPLEAAILLGAGQARQLVELMTSLLAGIANFAAFRSARLDLEPLRHALFQLECASPVNEEVVSAELHFYLVLAECLGNELLENALRVLQEALRSALRMVHETGVDGTETCRQVFDAVVEGDADRARRAVFAYGACLLQNFETADT